MSLQGLSAQVTPLLGARDTGLVDAGAMFVALSTPGSGIAGNAAGVATFVETTPYIIVYNSGLLNIYPLHLRLHTTAIGTGNSTGAQNWTMTLDTGNRFTSGGTALTPANCNMASAVKSGAVITVGGTLIATAATPVRRVVAHQAVKFGAIETIHDCLQFNFGGPEQADPTSLINNASSLSHTTVNFAPMVIGPGQSMLFYRWVAGNTALPAYEVEFGFVEK